MADIPDLNIKALLEHAKGFSTAFILQSGGHLESSPGPHNYTLLCGFGEKRRYVGGEMTLEDLSSQNSWLFGFLSYDLKNNFEELSSKNADFFSVPDFCFVEPKEIVGITADGELFTINSSKSTSFWKESLFSPSIDPKRLNSSERQLTLESTISKDEYLQNVESIRSLIEEGDVYELNYCQLFRAAANLDPYKAFETLTLYSPNPFSAFVKFENRFVVSGSMERFLCKEGSRILSQPIKGTLARSGENDEIEKMALRENEKERAENLMIVDLVRNDLNKSSNTGSVEVDELFGVYSYPGLHQMISTVSAEFPNDVSFQKIIQDTFPMGSMTGAPKISSMQHIEHLEDFKRGLFSGSIGYIKPNGDFDFSVVIRTIFYDANAKQVCVPVGSAITYDSKAKSEYEECKLKIARLEKILAACLNP